MRRFVWLWCVVVCVCVMPMALRGQELREEGCSARVEGFREVRDYVYLLYDETVMRTGPGKRYKVCRRYEGRRGLPFLEDVKVGDWHLVWDYRGAMGWIHESQLERSVRSVRVVRPEGGREVANVYVNRGGVDVRARLAWGYLVRVEFGWCGEKRCRVEAKTRDGKLEGWMRRVDLWGF